MDLFKTRRFGKKGLLLFWYAPSTNMDQTKIFAYNFSIYIGKRLELKLIWDKVK